MNRSWLWLIGGGIAAAVVFTVIGKKGQTNNSTDAASQFTPSQVLSSTGTPTNNDSLLGFTDPTTGIKWVLNASDQWAANLPQGTLPPNYIAGQAYLNGSPIGISSQ